VPTGERHAVLQGFDETDILAFGGTLVPLRVDSGAVVPLTYVPPFPTYPPETAWMRQPATGIPGLILSTHGASRVAYLPADVDRRYAREHLPDHARLLCHIYEQPARMIVHVVNLTSEASWRAPLDELIRVGPFKVKPRLPVRLTRPAARLLVSGSEARLQVANGTAALTIESILDHEVIVVEAGSR
jgi:hypothetical protein